MVTERFLPAVAGIDRRPASDAEVAGTIAALELWGAVGVAKPLVGSKDSPKSHVGVSAGVLSSILFSDCAVFAEMGIDGVQTF